MTTNFKNENNWRKQLQAEEEKMEIKRKNNKFTPMKEYFTLKQMLGQR